MKIYDETQHHAGIDLEGNNINKAKFPRIERDGLFVDEVRSNPTTGLLEIWDGTQWLGYIDTGALPSGTENQTLRHDGTEWVATVNSSLTDNNSNVEFKLVNNTLPTKKYTRHIVSDTNSQILVSGNISRLPDYNHIIDIQSTETACNLRLIYKTNQQIDIVSQDNYQMIRLTPNITSATALRFYVTKTYNATEKLISFSDYFSIYQNGKIVSNYLSGSGSALLEALPDGTIQRSSTALNTPLTYLSTNLTGTEHTFTGATLGITGDLRSRIKNIKCFAVDSNGDFNGALIANEFIYETELVVNSATNLSGSFKIKLFIEYY